MASLHSTRSGGKHQSDLGAAPNHTKVDSPRKDTSPASAATAADGLTLFRGRIAVLLKGPAVVEMDSPFLAEKLPSDSPNYWRDLRFPRAQMEFPFWEGIENDDGNVSADDKR
jgi:hypothetical protein